MSAIDWAAVETLLATVFEVATGLTPLWAYQTTQRPDPPVLLLHRSALRRLQPRDEEVIGYDAEQPLNEELEVQVTQWWQMDITLQALAPRGSLLGASAPEVVLAQALTAIQLEDVLESLDEAGLGLANVGDVLTDPEVFKPDWQPEARATVSFNLVLFATRRAGYIATYGGTVAADPVPAHEPPLDPQTFTLTPEADIAAEDS